jgi:hypothetical protein
MNKTMDNRNIVLQRKLIYKIMSTIERNETFETYPFNEPDTGCELIHCIRCLKTAEAGTFGTGLCADCENAPEEITFDDFRELLERGELLEGKRYIIQELQMEIKEDTDNKTLITIMK